MERTTDDTSVVCQESVPEFVSARITFQLDIGKDTIPVVAPTTPW